MSFLLVYCAIVLLIRSCAVDAEYDNQPKVRTKNGGLILEAAYDRNISLRLSHDSSLLLNDVDVMDKIRQRTMASNFQGGEAKQLDIPTTAQIGELVRQLQYDIERLSLRLSTLQNGTRSSLRLGAIRRSLGRMRRLSGRLSLIEQNMAIDECGDKPCLNGGTCYDAYKGYHCECTEGWTGKTCADDVDECYLLAGTDLGCQNNAVCTNTPGSYKCTCAKGFSGTHCRLRNAICQQYQSEELCVHGICVPANNQQGYTCICNQGWSRNTTTTANSTASLACDIDVDECEESKNPCHDECINLPGSFKCGPCPQGYTGNGLTCFDVDECATNNGGCSLLPKVRCINTEGSYRCGNCPVGWLGDGHSCDLAPTSSCDAEKICHPQAKCEFISEMATCTCPHGMFGHGFGPEGCHTTPITDSCENHICKNNGTCLSTGRSTSCLCPNGYSGALCETVDGCHPNPCENGATCIPQSDQTYKCTCMRGTTGKRCEVFRSVCFFILRKPSGELTYPTDGAAEYAAHERCAWNIRTSPSQNLNVTFTSFDVEEDPECSRDWLQIHDGTSLASQMIGRFCGKDLPLGGQILSSQHQLFFWFRSDNATNRPGFHMTWKSQPHICGDSVEVDVGKGGVIRSPGYPDGTAANRECQWKLSAPYGYRFVLRVYGVKLGARPNCTGDSLRIYDADLLLHEYCQTTSLDTVRSSSNQLKLHFHTDTFARDSSFQLHYEVESSVPHCGGVFTEAAGLIVGPTDQSICLYLIQQPPNTQIQLEFIDMNPLAEENCNLKSIEIFDGKTDEDAQLSISCGGSKPEPVVSSSNFMLIRYKNKLQTGDVKTPFNAKYTRVCEFRYFGPDKGVFSTPNYPNPYTEYITCTFHIYGPTETVIHANFTDFSIFETNQLSEETTADFNNETSVANSQDESTTYVDVYLSATNKRRYYKGAPMELISELNKMTIVFHANANSAKARGLRVEYSFEKIDCGGIYTEDEGTFTKYPKYTICKFVFEAPEGKRIHLSLDLYPLSDYARGTRKYETVIYGNATDGRDYLLKNVSAYSHIEETFNFNVITILPDKYVFWFVAHYKFENSAEDCGGNYSYLYGAIKSPNWPRPYAAGLDCTWVITAPFGYKIELTVQNFTLERPCAGDALEIRNGRYANSPLIGRYCGDRIPLRIPSFANSLHLRFTSDSSVEDVGFHITWQQTETGCGGKLTSFRGSIHSPHLETRQESMPSCDWLIHVSRSSAIALTITPAIDSLEFCRNNNLQIYDGSSALNPLMHFNCSEVLNEGQLKLTSSSNEVLIIYTPSMQASQYNNPDFVLDYETNCNVVLDHVQGIIESPNFPDLYPENLNCNWDIKAGSNNKIKLAFSQLRVEADNMECEYDYVEVWDMQNADVLKKYHLCTEIPEPITSEGNHLRIRFVTDYSNSKGGFRAEYIRVGCGELTTKELGSIQSPNYPYSANADCDWYIEVPAGRQIVFSIFEFQLDMESSDCSTDMMIVKESKNSTVTLLKKCSSQQTALVVTSPSNRLYVHYRSGPSSGRKFFKALYHTKEASCGGTFRSDMGTITSPNYPYNTTQDYSCKWEINVPYPYGIFIHIKDFHLSESANCSDNSLRISEDTNTSSGKFCTLEKSSMLIRSHRVLIEYTSKGSQSWGRFSLDYAKQCGGKIEDDGGLIKASADDNCLWTFDVPEGTVISFNILQLDCYCAKDARGEKKCGIHGLGFMVNYFGTDIVNSNHTKYYCEQHQSNLVFEASKLYVFSNSINFHATYSTTQNSCGGMITSARGSLASPHYPAFYPANVECTWMISAKQGNSLQLQFDQLDIASSEHCNEDFVEVRTRQSGKLLGVYCGHKLPDEILTSLDSFWIRFYSSQGSTGYGFKMSWSYAHLNEIMNATQGVIESPPLTMVYHEEEAFAWRILVEREQFIALHFQQYNQGLILYDGFDDTALEIPIPSSPWRFVSSSNVVFLKTDNDNVNYFFIKWNTTKTKAITTNTTTSKCHAENVISSRGSVMVSSPNYPRGYEPNLHCDWIYKPANVTEHIICEMYEVKLEVTNRCSADYVKISTSTDLLQWHEMERLCNSTDKTFKAIATFHGTPNLKLDFVSDATLNRTGFIARITTRCGSNLTQSVGFIEGNKLRYEAVCLWHIKVKPSKRILLQLDYPPSVPSSDHACADYAVIYDGFDEHAPILPPGKICSPQNVSQILMNSTTNYLTVKYNLSVHKPFPLQRWNLTFREYSECNEEFRLIPEASTINVTSPNYPNVPHPHTECEWRVVAPQGELIQVEFIERFDMNARFCEKEFVELFDGSTSLARTLGKYCRKPVILKTTQNILYMHYWTDINEPRAGFKARISISKCGGSYSAMGGVLLSPGYPSLGAYPSNSQCDYAISLPAEVNIRLKVHDVNLPFDVNQLKSSDYLEIIPITVEGGETVQPILIYGNATKDTQFDLDVSKAIVRFHTFAKNTQYRGFMLKYDRLSGQCNQEVTGQSGIITLRFPKKAYFSSYCRWKITVPKGLRVRLEFLNMGDLKEQNSTRYPTFFIFNDHEQLSKITSFDGNTFDSNKIIQSSDNTMLVRVFIPTVDIRFKTVKARYSADEVSPCPSNIEEDNLAGLIDIQDRQPVFKSNYNCMIKIKSDVRQTLAFNITTFEYTQEARVAQIIYPLSFRDNIVTSNYRENLTHFLHPHTQAIGYVRIVQADNEHIRRLKMDYRLHKCGGYFGVASDFSAKQPEITDVNYGAIMCVWTLSKPYYNGLTDSEYRLAGNFTFSDSCDREFIMIKERRWQGDPVKKVCRDSRDTLEGYVFKNSLTFIVYQSENYTSQKTQFSIETKKSMVCGGETKVMHMTWTVEVDKDSYKNNDECSWVFYTQPGYYLQLHFFRRFFIEASPNCTKDYLEILHEEGGLWISDGRYCGREFPADYNASTPRIQVIFRTNEAVTGDGFSFSVRRHCSVTLNVTSTIQTVVSPTTIGYRNQRLQCEYIFVSNETDKLINVRTSLEPGRYYYAGSDCRSGFIATKFDANGIQQAGDRHCEAEIEERGYRYLKLAYDGFSMARYTIEYGFDTCGGNITSSATSIRPLKHESFKQYADNMNCVWYITAPPDHSIAVRFKYFDTEPNYDHVSIYTGYQIQGDKRLVKLTGNLTDNPPTVMVDHSQAVVNAISDVSNGAKGFEAQIVFLPNCHERISLTDGNSPVNLARNFKLVAGEEYMCLYRLSAPKGYRIRVDLKKLQINNATTGCDNADRQCAKGACNTVEVVDSAAMNQASMGKFCSRTNTSLTSSYGDASLKFIAAQSGQYSFEIILTMQNSVCGPLTEYKLGEEEKFTLSFPQHGELLYASNTHCSWLLKSDYPIVLHFNYIDLQNKSQISGKCLDYVQVKGSYTSNQFCGHATNYTMAMERAVQKGVEVTFHSDASVEGKGFELQVGRANMCNQTHTQLSGRFQYFTYGLPTIVCNDTITVPENYNLNFYIFALNFENYDCQKLHLRITDLKDNRLLFDRCRNSYRNLAVFTTSNAVRIEASDFKTIFMNYVSSERNLPPGCGGSTQTSDGFIASPVYENDRNFSECRWNITVPAPNKIRLMFQDFNMGPMTNCHLDNVKVIDVMPDGSEKLLKTLCGPDSPEPLTSTSNRVVIVSKKSPNFDGTGWTLMYQLETDMVGNT